MAKLKVGTKVDGRYNLKELKGSGSFGEVWLAHDELLGDDVAVKIYIPLDKLGVEEFKSEYKTTLGLYHTNLLRTDYFSVWEQHPYLVMKYCSRGSASVQVGNMDEYMLWQFIHDVAAGLKYLHNLPEPIVHQDIKPDNILIDDDGKYLITDFGISKKVRSTMRKQSKRAVGAGATAYMAPERFNSAPTPIMASDIWSLGVSIYELATGELPFSGLGGGMQKNGAALPELDKQWSKEMNRVMQSCLAKDPWNRPAAQQLEDFSEAIINGKPAEYTWPHPESWDSCSNPGPGGGDGGGEGGGTSDFEKLKSTSLIIVSIVIICVLVLIGVCISQCSSDGTVDDTLEPPTEQPGTRNETEMGKGKDSIDYTDKGNANEEETITQETNLVKVPEPPTTPTGDKATALKNALKNGDYATVQELANQGYAPAYGPLAEYYLRNNDYNTAESYAKKAGSEGTQVLKTLDALGYYE